MRTYRGHHYILEDQGEGFEVPVRKRSEAGEVAMYSIQALSMRHKQEQEDKEDTG